MKVLIDNLAKEYFHRLMNVANEEILDSVNFQEDNTAPSSIGTNSSAISGVIQCQKDDQHCLSESVFIKFHRTTDQSHAANLKPWFENEIHFYQRICPFLHSVRSIDHLVPKFLTCARFSNADGDTIAIMLQRLGPEWVCNNWKSLMDLSHLSMMMRKLGEFHAYSFAACRKNAKEFEKLANSATNVIVSCSIPVYCPKLVPILQMGLQPLRPEPKYREAVARVDQILSNFPNQVTRSFYPLLGTKFSVLCHLGYNQSNVLFRYKNGNPVDMKIMDWQTASISSLGVDLIRILYTDASQQMRGVHWERLLDDYHEALSSTFKNCDTPSRDDMLEELRHSACAAPFMLARRVLQSNVELDLDGGKQSHSVWSIRLLTDMFKDLIDRGLL